tara:strand:- start:1851 stop:2132 length:282 start_codon:yes stop_codon:yes gene_type:complete
MFKPIKTVPLDETVILRVDFPDAHFSGPVRGLTRPNPLIVLGEVLKVQGKQYHCYFGTYTDTVRCMAPDDWDNKFTHWAPIQIEPVKKKRKEG